MAERDRMLGPQHGSRSSREYEMYHLGRGGGYEPRARALGDVLKEYFGEHIKVPSEHEAGFTFDIAAVQSFALFYLQTRIVSATSELFVTTEKDQINTITKYLAARMHEYCDAVRDREYMEQWVKQKPHGNEDNPFQLCPSRELERTILVEYGLIKDNPLDANDRTKPYLPGSELGKRDLEHLTWYWRPIVSLATGGVVIAPVAIILFVDVKSINLIITFGFMAAIAFILVWVPGLRTRDAIGLTAAYASVLVVFVGAKTNA